MTPEIRRIDSSPATIVPVAEPSSVTTSFPVALDPWTRPPGIAATLADTLSSTGGSTWMTTPATWNGPPDRSRKSVLCGTAAAERVRRPRREREFTALVILPSMSGRSGDELVHPDQESVAADDHDAQHRRHHDGEEKEAAKLKFPAVCGIGRRGARRMRFRSFRRYLQFAPLAAPAVRRNFVIIVNWKY